MSLFLTLHRPQLDALDQVLLQDHEQDDHRARRIMVTAAISRCVDWPCVESKNSRPIGSVYLCDALEHDQRPEEALVVADEREDGQRDQARPRQRQDDVPEELPLAGAVDLGGLVEARGDASA